MPPPAHPYLPRPGKEYMAQAVDGAPAKGIKTTKPACRQAKSMMQGTANMQNQTLASCQIIPLHISIAIDGGVHLDGLSLVIVIVLWIMIRKQP
ncbi:hypothetical protein [Sutterella wadsworthensis]|uniref:hypothetical protein n=1 Tax=Sutterella wadsworthensis TaxID=40545 RepID=UPI0019D1F4B5|nr:hypothetical protein [Sutterella wadsworthensis]